MDQSLLSSTKLSGACLETTYTFEDYSSQAVSNKNNGPDLSLCQVSFSREDCSARVGLVPLSIFSSDTGPRSRFLHDHIDTAR